MKVLQLIDSLEAGGAETYGSELCQYANRRAAIIFYVQHVPKVVLKNTINHKVGYLFLDKKSTLWDFNAIFTLRKFVKQHKIDIIHAHSSSYFLAVCVKLTIPKLKIVWHDHYGNSEFLHKRKNKILKFCSLFFSMN